MKEANLCLKQIEARIPELIEADRMLYKQLSDENTHTERNSRPIPANNG